MPEAELVAVERARRRWWKWRVGLVAVPVVLVLLFKWEVGK
jgi:hypothetical protein